MHTTSFYSSNRMFVRLFLVFHPWAGWAFQPVLYPLGSTMSVLALSLGLSTVLILAALHIASYTHIHARGHTHILTTIHNCIRRSSCKGESCHKCHELQVPKDQHPIPKPRRFEIQCQYPPENLHPWPYERRQHIALHNSPTFKEPYPH